MVNSFLLDFFSGLNSVSNKTFFEETTVDLSSFIANLQKTMIVILYFFSNPLSLTGQKCILVKIWIAYLSSIYVFNSIPPTDASTAIRKKDFMSSILLMFIVTRSMRSNDKTSYIVDIWSIYGFAMPTMSLPINLESIENIPFFIYWWLECANIIWLANLRYE